MEASRSPTAPPALAVLVAGTFCATASTIGTNDLALFCSPPWEVAAGNPVLFFLGFGFGAILVHRCFAGARIRTWPWLVAWAAVAEVASLVALFGQDRRGQGLGELLTGGVALLAFLLSVPAGLLFGLILMRFTLHLAERLRGAWIVALDPRALAGAAAPWLLVVAAAKWLTQPLSLHGFGAAVAAAASIGLAARARRWGMFACATLLLGSLVFVKGCVWEQDREMARVLGE